MLTLGRCLVRVGGEGNGRRRRDRGSAARRRRSGRRNPAKGSRGCGSADKEGAAGSFVRVWERRGEGSRWCGSVEKGAVAETLIGMRERDERLEGDERDERESLNERNNYQKGLLARSFLFRCKMINVGSFR